MMNFLHTNMMAMSAFDLILSIALGILGSVVIALTVYFTVKLIWKLCKLFWKGLRKIFRTPKEKCAAIQCPFCGKMLDRCSCQKNYARTYRQRLRSYKRWKRQHNCTHVETKK